MPTTPPGPIETPPTESSFSTARSPSLSSGKQLSRIQILVEQILFHRSLYYSGKSVLPDQVYDALEEELRLLDPSNAVFSEVGAERISAQSKVEHEPPMLSLEKTYLVEDLDSFFDKGAVVCSEKFDGMALSLEYSNVGQLVRASTRGNGSVGENVTPQVHLIRNIPKRIATPLPDGFSLEIRGEVFFPMSEFESFSERFDSYRNAVPGTFGRKEIQEAEDVLRVLGFCAYDVLIKKSSGELVTAEERKSIGKGKGTFETFFAKLAWLESLGFYSGVQSGATVLIESDADAKSVFLAKISGLFEKKRDYLIDGLVFRIDDEVLWEQLGNTSHHPRGSLAFKQAGESAQTKILGIETNIGRSGKVSFRANLDPVFLSGAKISYATLHNADFVTLGRYAPGAVVEIKRSGEVIPSIFRCVQEAETPYELPQNCPCGYALSRVGPDLFCLEKRPCPEKDQESLVHFLGALEILGISDKTVVKLVEGGLVKSPADFYRLTVEDVLQVEGFAQKSAENFVQAFASKKVLGLAEFLTALGLKRGGKVKCQEVARAFHSLSAVRKVLPEDLVKLKGWAEKSSEDFVESLQEKSPWIEDLLCYVIVEDVPVSKRSFATQEQIIGQEDSQGNGSLGGNTHPLFGKSVCITGALSRPRGEWEKLLQSLGAKLASGVTSKTHFLVCNESSGSSKYKQAVALGIPILDEDAFSQLLLAPESPKT